MLVFGIIIIVLSIIGVVVSEIMSDDNEVGLGWVCGMLSALGIALITAHISTKQTKEFEGSEYSFSQKIITTEINSQQTKSDTIYVLIPKN
jgi:hypothetical protein